MITILGPTATGKTRLAALVADALNGEIISADSRQVFRKMNIGTGKDYDDYVINNKIIKVHLIDIEDPGKEYNVYRFVNDFNKTYELIIQNNKLPVLCGGTGLYIEAVLKGYYLPKVPINENLRKELNGKS
ncbi:MAG TPA: isopentenyl transferase family protein, partial [Bacteroidales bacterium]|nr:isopentenyl transferase family protein [Bacteroidales bacterium]